MLHMYRRSSPGVGDKATFVEGDMFESDFSQATVLALFLLADNMLKLRLYFELDFPLLSTVCDIDDGCCCLCTVA